MDELKRIQEQIESGINKVFDTVPKDLWFLAARILQESFNKVFEEKKEEALEYILEQMIPVKDRLLDTIQRIREEEL